MCGITGFFGRAAVDPSLLKAMAMAIKHRGPDHTGTLIEGRLGLAMNRLSIIDLTGGNQPMHSSDRQVSLVFNGEIYNFRELRKTLTSEHPFKFKTKSDTEVVLNGYLAWEDAVFTRLNGIFAVAIWDRRRNLLVLARDSIGVKPLYYLCTKQGFYFASELKSFTKNRLANYPNFSAIQRYLCAGYVFHPETALEGVFQVEPGAMLLVDKDIRVTVRRFRSIGSPMTTEEPADGDWRRQVRSELANAVVRQTVADVPFGLLLSVGIDSMTILAALREKGLANNLQTFTVYYEQTTFSENRLVKRLAHEWGFVNHQLLLTGRDVRASLGRIFDTFDNLELLPTCVCIYAASQLAGQTMRVLLAGNGGDELFLGYPTYRATKLLSKIGRFRAVVYFLRPLAAQFSVSDTYLSTSERIRRFFLGSSTNPTLAHLQWRHVFTYDELAGLLSDRHWLPTVNELYEPQLRFFHEAERLGYRGLDVYTWGDLNTWLIDCGLCMWDKAGMSASAEIRVPLLDNHLLDYIMAVPQNIRAPRPGTKSFMRQLFADTLPRYVTRHSKRGFQAPVAAWLRGDLRETFRELASALPSSLVRPAVVDRLWHDFDARRGDNALKLWVLGCLAGWASVHGVDLS